jgi:hypothetical protein
MENNLNQAVHRVRRMLNKTAVHTLSATAIIVLILLSPLFTAQTAGWSNGGYSANPATPDYGTHDWVAEHALDWLPTQEKQLILDNKAVYLYGTELPDNGQAADGIGDITKHHVYYRADGSVQDDAAAVRARDEYTKAVNAFNAGNRSGAAKELGIVAHYVADMAVYAHVMGASTAWNAEQHHSDYEDYVDTRTNSYQDTFNSYLSFDGNLTTKTAYDVVLALAHDSTFDDSGNLTCVWMDTNYNWSNPTFANRAGESLNLAVNAVTDVLHTFYTQTAPIIPEFPTTPTLTLLLLFFLPVALLSKKKALHRKP